MPAVKRKKPRKFYLVDGYTRERTYVGAIYALFDAKGELFGVYGSVEKAEHDAVGPRFRPRSTVVRYWAGKATVI